MKSTKTNDFTLNTEMDENIFKYSPRKLMKTYLGEDITLYSLLRKAFSKELSFNNYSYIYSLCKKIKDTGIYPYMRPLASAAQAKVIIQNKEMLMFGSNNYLGLCNHPKIKESAIKAIEKYGVGSGGVRLMSGTMDLHERLEEKVAEFKGTESAIVFSTGFFSNFGTIPTLIGKKDIIINDELNHASIFDATKMIEGKEFKFKHNNMKKLEKVLKPLDYKINKLIVVDGVFSMDGDIAKLPEIYDLAKKYNAKIMIDDAHATGVIGKNGRGTAEHFGLEGQIDIVGGTFSKALGLVGGFIASSKEIVNYLKHMSRPFIFSTSLPPAIAAAAIAAIEIIEEEPGIRSQLGKNIDHMKDGLKSLGFKIGNSESAIIPILVNNDLKTFILNKMLNDKGVFVNPIIFPAIGLGQSRIRVSMMATHTSNDIDRVLETFKKCGQALRII